MVQALPTLLTFLPLLGVIALLLSERTNGTLHRRLGIGFTLPPLALAVWMFVKQVLANTSLTWTHAFDWFYIPLPQGSWTFQYMMQIDGLSLVFIMLTCLITTMATIASHSIHERTRAYYSLILLLQVGMLGVFSAFNLFLFFIFFEITLISMYFLIGIWGFLHKEKAANYFLLYNGLGSGFLLFAMIGLLMLAESLNYDDIANAITALVQQLELLPPEVGLMVWGVFGSLMIAFAIKLPIFPFHTWMLKVHVEAPTPIVMIHSGVLLKMGAYGMIRFGYGFFPTFMQEIAFTLAIVGVISILYGALLAIVESELKKVLAYSSISHMGIVLIGLGAMNETGLKGAVFQSISHGLISALLFYLVGRLYQRTQTTQFNELGGLAKSMPVFSGILMVGVLALLGLPGTSGFISEFFAFLALFASKPIVAAIGTLGLIFAAFYALRIVLKVSFGPIADKHMHLSDLRFNESIPMLILVVVIIMIGISPAVLSYPIDSVLHTLITQIGGQ
ncbi:NADH-quinone oxidoreductase subunit M [Hazenella sp. IB182357]|uniref:NADH-quinone oxidoreductase subunit M n=1 Tax=Polycladospora coralii TaxID=2771432 RepID=A0A926RX35_9BACL|nr:NADH-quinone oxidoreductase subunit M [Polycladospora coralii]